MKSHESLEDSDSSVRPRLRDLYVSTISAFADFPNKVPATRGTQELTQGSPAFLFARGQPRAIMDDLVRDAIFKILKPLKDRDNISRKEAERIEDDVAESVSFAF